MGFHAPGSKDLISVVMVMMFPIMMVTAAAVLVIIVMMVVMLLFVMVTAAAVLILIVMMVVMLLFMMVTATAVLILTVMMVVVMFFFHLCQIHRNLCFTLHSLHQLGSGKQIPGGGNDGSLGIMLAEHGNRCIQLFRENHICTGQHNRGGGFDLVIIELAEILHIHLHLAGIYHSNGAIQGHILICNLLHSSNHVGKLTHTGGFNHNAVRVIFADDLGQCLAKITHQAAADTAGIHLGNVDAGILQEATINANFTEFVLNQHQLLTRVGLGNHFLNQCGLAGTQKTGINVNLCHFSSHFPSKFCPLSCGHFLIRNYTTICRKIK